ncbi:MAG: glutaminyl-peptide cyclotransferase [Thermoguttaceae bacterium]
MVQIGWTTSLCNLFLLSFFVLRATWAEESVPPPVSPSTLRLALTAQTPHDSQAFTQGLVFDGGVLYESAGGYGTSSLRRVEVATGNVVEKVAIPRGVFAEGIAIVGDEIFMISWESEVCFVFNKTTLREVRRYKYRGEGWGLTFDGTSLWMSSGSATLQRRDPKTFEVVDTVSVVDGTTPIRGLNELEWVDGEIWANVFGSLRIARIDPKSGRVVGWVDMASLLPREIPLRDATTQLNRVLNGIAFDPTTRRLYITGKLWPVLYVLEIVQP